MKNIEGIKQPEIRDKELLSLIESIEWKSWYAFSYNGTNFLLFILEEDDIKSDVGGEQAEIYPSSQTGGWDIYLHNTISESERSRVLFHEILEGDLAAHGFPMKDAHEVALKEEQKIFGERENNLA